MEMISAQFTMASRPALGLNVSHGQSGKGDIAGFQNVLIHYVGSQESGRPTASPLTESAIDAAQSVAAAALTSDIANVLPMEEELAEWMDSLLGKLELISSSDDSTLSEEQLSELQANLDQLNALLALFGALTIQSEQLQWRANVSQGSEAANSSSSAIQVSSALQDALLQLQAIMQQGTLKQVKLQNPESLIVRQLEALTAVIDGNAASDLKADVKPATTVPAWLTARPAQAPDTSVMLQRMTDRSISSTSLIYGSLSANPSESSNRMEPVVMDAEPVPAAQLAMNYTDNLRPLVMAKTVSPISFVMADQFAESMSDFLIQKLNITTLNGVSEAKIMLYPEHLGQVDVRITMQNGLLTAAFHTENVLAKEMLENQMAQLRLALQGQGITVDKIEVSHQPSAAQMFQQQHGQHGNQQQQSNQRSVKEEENGQDHLFESELVEQAAIQELGYGRMINASV